MFYYSLGLTCALILSIYVSKGNGLKCYHCEGWEKNKEPDNCYKVTNTTPTKVVNDYEPLGPLNLVQKKTKAGCGKIQIDIPDSGGLGNTHVIRRALDLDDDNDGSKYCHASGPKQPGFSCGVCFTDLCNSSISVRAGYFSFYTVTVGLLVSFYRMNY